MQENDFKILEKFISKDRLSLYRRGAANLNACISKYLWNISLSQSMYPVLNQIEICLRNSTNIVLTQRHGSRWFDNEKLSLGLYQKERVEVVKNELHKQKKQGYAGQIIAELSFGFWVSMYGTWMDRHWRGQAVRNAFPHAPKSERNRKSLFKKLDEIRHFRNRVFHHERILHCEPVRHHQQCCQIIKWIEPQMLRLITLCDQFPSVYSNGLEQCRGLLNENFENKQQVDTDSPQ